jgi:hypothetical protein
MIILLKKLKTMLQKIKFLALCLFSCNLLTADFTPQDITILHQMGALCGLSAVYVAYNYAESQLSDTHSAEVVDKYPYAQAWFDVMVAKYPDTQLDQLTFLQSASWMSQGHMAWQSRYKKVYCPAVTLQVINDLYDEKLYPKFAQKLTLYQDSVHDKELDLKIAEFLLLRQAYHCKHNTTLITPLQFVLSAGMIAGASEIMHQAFFQKSAHVLLQAPIVAIFLCNLLERQELQADIFAYEQAIDFNVFNGAIAYFSDEDLVDSVCQLQPSFDQRTEKMFEYLKFEKQN